MPFAQVTFSGSGSLHAIVSISDTLPFKPHTEDGVRQYSQAWRAINAELTQLASEILGTECPARVFDPSCKDAARLSRTPNAVRPDTTATQAELPGFGGYLSADDVLALMRKHGYGEAYSAPTSVEQVSDMDLETFNLALLLPENKGLRSKLASVDEWAASENMYPALFQLSLWIIDSVGAPLNTTVAYMREHIFPAVRAANYPRNPEIAIHNAYIWKGLS